MSEDDRSHLQLVPPAPRFTPPGDSREAVLRRLGRHRRAERRDRWRLNMHLSEAAKALRRLDSQGHAGPDDLQLAAALTRYLEGDLV